MQPKSTTVCIILLYFVSDSRARRVCVVDTTTIPKTCTHIHAHRHNPVENAPQSIRHCFCFRSCAHNARQKARAFPCLSPPPPRSRGIFMSHVISGGYLNTGGGIPRGAVSLATGAVYIVPVLCSGATNGSVPAMCYPYGLPPGRTAEAKAQPRCFNNAKTSHQQQGQNKKLQARLQLVQLHPLRPIIASMPVE